MPTPRHRWFPGYTVAGVSTLAFIATAPGQTMIVSTLNEPLRQAFAIEEFTLNTAYMVATVAASLPLVYVGKLTDRLGPRRMMALVALAFGLACLAMGAAQGFLTAVLGFFLLRFLGQGSLSLVSQHATAMWFHRRLGFINGLKMVVVFTAWIALPQVAVRMIETIGWRWTYASFGLAVWLLIIPAALLLLRDRPEDVGAHMDNDPPHLHETHHEPRHESPSENPSAQPPASPRTPRAPEPVFTLKEALRTRAYWTLLAAFVLAPLIGTAFLFDIQPILDERGMDKTDAANAVSAWSAAMAVMALPSGWLTDRFRASTLVCAGTIAIALSAALLWRASTPLAAAGAMAAYGVGQALVATCVSTTTARYFGRAHHGAIRSFQVRLGVLGTGLGPLITGASASLTGAYSLAMITLIALCLPVAALALTLRPPARATPDQP
jgi:MFS family permease